MNKITFISFLSLAIIFIQCEARSGQSRITGIVPTQKAIAASHASGLLSGGKAKMVSLKEFITMKDSQIRKMTKKKFPGDVGYVEDIAPLNATGAVDQGTAILYRSLKEMPTAVISFKKTQEGLAAYQKELAGAEQSVKTAAQQILAGEKTVDETATQIQDQARGMLDKAQGELLQAKKRLNKQTLDHVFTWKNGQAKSISGFLKTEGAKLVQRYPQLEKFKGSMSPFVGMLGIDSEELFEMWRSGKTEAVQAVATKVGDSIQTGQTIKATAETAVSGVKTTIEGAKTVADVADIATKPLQLINKVVN